MPHVVVLDPDGNNQLADDALLSGSQKRGRCGPERIRGPARY